MGTRAGTPERWSWARVTVAVALTAAMLGGCASRRTGTPPPNWTGLELELAAEAARRGVSLPGLEPEPPRPATVSAVPAFEFPTDASGPPPDADAILAAIQGARSAAAARIEEAAAAEDLSLLSCLHARGSSLEALLGVAVEAGDELVGAPESGDDAAVERARSRLHMAYATARKTNMEVEACLGDGAASRSGSWRWSETKSNESRATGRGEAAPRERWQIVRVYYATDRKLTGQTEPTRRHGDEPRCPLDADGGSSIPAGDPRCVEFGEAVVSIPPGHQVGEVESPSMLRLEFRRDPNHHMVLHRVRPLVGEEFFERVDAHLDTSEGEQILVYVHGYNTTFDYAVVRTAQMVHDLGFDGVGVAWSWASRGTLIGYWDDAEHVEASARHLRVFLERLATDTDARAIHVVAHSMGNRVLANALAAAPVDGGPHLDQIVLAAPDIDANGFAELTAPNIQRHARRVTLYTSDRDRALLVSRLINVARRAGDASASPVLAEGVDTIDASGMDSTLLGHGYISTEASLLRDLGPLLLGEVAGGALRRWLTRVPGGWWTFAVP